MANPTPAAPPPGLRLTPLFRQYFEIKAQHPDALLLYRMGDFYELFFEDAVRAAPILEVALTSRDKGAEVESPMCGVPHHAIDGYVAKLIRAGESVAICDQVEDPRSAKGLVRREVTRVVTPGTAIDAGLLDGRETVILSGLVPPTHGTSGGIAFLDLATGDYWGFALSSGDAGKAELDELLAARAPREILVPVGHDGLPTTGQNLLVRPRPEEDFAPNRGERLLLERFRVPSAAVLGLTTGSPLLGAAGAVLRFAEETQRAELPHIERFRVGDLGGRLLVDARTLSNLEVLKSRDDEHPRACLAGVLDLTSSPPGARLLRALLAAPLADRAAIERRLDAVEELLEGAELRARLRTALGGIGDLERAVGRISLPSGGPRDLGAIRDALAKLPTIVEIMRTLGAARGRALAEAIDPAPELFARLAAGLADELPPSAAGGGAIRTGFDRELDELRDIRSGSQRALLEIERRERERTGIASLKVRYNRVFGFYIEVSKANTDKVPADYDRKQTLVGAERYTMPELAELETKALVADERSLARELELFADLRQQAVARANGLRATAKALAEIDVLATLAEVAKQRSYVRPQLADSPTIEIVGGRHPVVERFLPASQPFIPNDLALGGEIDSHRILVLTGPNMGGKSTYLRQNALIALLAHAGSFVPAERARVGVLDRLFTRLGASDHLARGESTFMVEMTETATILRNASERSLVVLDEVGRGTATFDGLSLAWAIVEHLATDTRCRPLVLFATHYHELTDLARLLPQVGNAAMTVKEWQERIVFLHRVRTGISDKSYGIQVARLAGLPEAVLLRAREILRNLEETELDPHGRPTLARHGEGTTSAPPAGTQMELFAPQVDVVLDALRRTDLDALTPLAALNLLASFQARLTGRDEPGS